MPYSTEIVSRARDRLARRRADRESETAARLQQAYTELPRLRQIDTQLRRTMAMAAQAVFAAGGDAQQAMERVRQENQALQAERKALLESHYAPNWLDEQPICSTCGGTGYIGSAMCTCLKQLCAEEQQRELGAIFTGSESFETFRLDYYPNTVTPPLKVSARTLMEKNLDNCRRYARGFGPDAGNLLMGGGTGLGKTHLALAIGKAVGRQGYSVRYETAVSLFAKLEKAKFTPTEENRREAEALELCDLLIIDDLGTEMPGQFVTAALYGLLNQRLMTRRAMVITTNLTVDEAGRRYSPQIASRLYGEFQRLTFMGEDIRVLKNRGL
ncbi:MAG: ATP-binding protein [Oscillospiraceae bacterium]|nr:ATP-binding protein [Oscillospiraceae bacterium]